MGALLNALGINLPALLAQIVNFGVLFALLAVVAFRPIMKKLDERAQAIKASMEQAEQVRQQAARAEEEVKKRLEAAAREGQEMIARATRTGEEVRQQAQQQARRDAEVLLARARQEIEKERDDAIGHLRREFADLTMLAAEKVISRSLDRKAHRELIEQVLEGSTLKKG